MSITVSRLIARGKTLPPVAAYSWPNTAVHAVSVAVTLFAATGIVLTWDRTPVSAWLIVAIVVLSQPIDSRSDEVSRESSALWRALQLRD